MSDTFKRLPRRLAAAGSLFALTWGFATRYVSLLPTLEWKRLERVCIADLQKYAARYTRRVRTAIVSGGCPAWAPSFLPPLWMNAEAEEK
jgi:hypothetical protein